MSSEATPNTRKRTRASTAASTAASATAASYREHARTERLASPASITTSQATTVTTTCSPATVAVPVSLATATAAVVSTLGPSSASTSASNPAGATTSVNEGGRPQRKRVRTRTAPIEIRQLTSSSQTPDDKPAVSPTPVPDPTRFEVKNLIIGTMYCKPASYLRVVPAGLMLCIHAVNGEKEDILLPFSIFGEYSVCDCANLPLIVIRTNASFGETVRAVIPSLKRTDAADLSNHIFDPISSDKCHWYIIAEMRCATELCDIISKLMQSNITSNSMPDNRLFVPKPISVEEARRRLNATQTVILKWKELQLGTWKSKSCTDGTIHMSGSRIKFKANTGTSDVTLAIHLNEVSSLMLCAAQANPVLFVRASETFGWSARDRLGLSSTFQQGRDYYNPDSPETRFKYVTFRLEKQGLSRDLWQQIYDMSGERFYTIDHISSRTATEIIHKLTYRPISCKSVRVGANELDEIRAVTIHFDSLCICGCMLDSVVTMNICIADIKEISLCTDPKLPVMFVKTSTAISETLKKNMSTRSGDVYFDPNSKEIRTQYIVLEFADATTKESLKAIHSTLQSALLNFNDRVNIPKEQRANSVKILSKKKSEELLSTIKEPLLAMNCTCGKKEDVKFKEEVRQYVQSMTQKHGCEVLEKMASRAVDLQKKILCSVCLDKDCQIVFSCGHMICERCDQSLKKCHICRMKILRRVKIFI